MTTQADGLAEAIIGAIDGSDLFFGGTIGRVLAFNMTLDPTDAEQKAVIHGGQVPYSLQGASNDEITVTWANSDFVSFTSAGDSITEMVATTGSQNCYSKEVKQ